MNELTKLTIAEAREKLVQKEISSAELTDSYIGAIETSNASLNAYVALTFDQAWHQGSVLHQRRSQSGLQPYSGWLQAKI